MTDNHSPAGAMQACLAVARGDEPAELLLKGGRVVDVFSGAVATGNVAICGELIAGVGSSYTAGEKIIDLDGAYVTPGLIDAHLHVESTLLLPPELGRIIVGHGTTTVIHDPHEIANVLGEEGVNMMIELSKQAPCDFFATVPSSVPSTDLETAGGELDARTVEKLLQSPFTIGLGEMMNYPGVIAGEAEVLKKILAAKKAGKVIDGHAPAVGGKNLQAYLSAGITTDHECITAAEAQEKMAGGMKIIIRHGSATSSLSELVPLVNPLTGDTFMLGSDDREAGELLEQGHLNEALKKAVAMGADPLLIIKIATLNAARHYRLYDRGAVAPGYRADLAIFEDLENFRARLVIKDGREAAREGRALAPVPGNVLPASARESVRLSRLLEAKDFVLLPSSSPVPVIGVVPGQLITEKLFIDIERDENDNVSADPVSGINKIAVIERHGRNGNIAVGLIRGIGLQKGALASSVAHDSHNLVVAGASEEAMARAANELAAAGGGFAVVGEDNTLKALLPLPAGGLMSDQPAEWVAEEMTRVLEAARELGTALPQPFLTLSFMALPVIPSLKITDRGMVDVDNFTFL